MKNIFHEEEDKQPEIVFEKPSNNQRISTQTWSSEAPAQPTLAELWILLCMLQIFLKLDSCRDFVGLSVLQKQNPFICTYSRDL